MFWERDVYVNLLMRYLREEEARQRQQSANINHFNGKAAIKLKIRNFPVTTSGMDKKDPAMSMTLAVNRLGATVTDVGKILTSSHQARLDAAYQVQGRRSLAQDRAREKQIEKKTAENIDKESEARGYKKGGSGIFGLLSPLIEPLIALAAKIATFFALDFLSKPENKEMIKTGFSWIGKWLGTVWKIGSKGSLCSTMVCSIQMATTDL